MTNLSYPISELGILKPLMQKFADKDPDLLPFINHYSSSEAYAEQIKQKSSFAMDRDVLVEDILDQYGNISRVSESARANDGSMSESERANEGSLSESARANIQKLKLENTYTVITGHQPCLFTGPLYFIIKILQTIKLANTLDAHFSEYNIVPVYWMGAEDHDFEEVNHFNLYRKTLTWDSIQEGSVGRFNTEGLEAVREELKEILGEGKNEAELIHLFKRAYIDHNNYGDATRFLVNELFGDRGLIIVDGDRPKLKAQFKDTFEKELQGNFVHRLVNESNAELSKHGKVQVKPREINLFYLDRLGRNRIVADVNGLSVDGRKGIRNTEAMVEELQDSPERFSPNVLLRPVYQETILPNLAYIGGPGETAYWLELKSLFESVNLPMPIVELRNSCVFIDEKQLNKLNALGLEVKDLFLEESEWSKKLILGDEEENLFKEEHKTILASIDSMKEKAAIIDPTLSQVFEGEKKRMEKSLENLEKRVFKAQKRKNEVTINQVKKIKDRLFPGGGLMERKENFSALYARDGKGIFDKIYEGIDAEEAKMNVVVV